MAQLHKYVFYSFWNENTSPYKLNSALVVIYSIFDTNQE